MRQASAAIGAQHIRAEAGLCQLPAFELPAAHKAREGRVMRRLIAGNWKMHMLRGPATELATAVHAGAQGLACDLLMCPPFTAVEPVARVLAGSAVAVGGQDCHAKGQGAHTGDVSAAMLRDAGATWVILGHSERRQNHGETDELGSSGQETEVVGWQIAGSLPKPFAGVVAYEPCWAIGTGKTATEQDVATMHAFIREELVRQFGDPGAGIRILYGGSMRPANAGS